VTVAVLALTITAGLLGAGCTEQVCAGPAQLVPAVFLDASPWLAAHPDAQLRACYGSGPCRTLTHGSDSQAQLPIGSGGWHGAHVLTIQSTDAAAPVHVERQVTLHEVISGQGCARTDAIGENVVLNANGTLTLRGWSGQVLPPEYSVPR